MRRVIALSLKKKPTRVFAGCSAARCQLCSLSPLQSNQRKGWNGARHSNDLVEWTVIYHGA